MNSILIKGDESLPFYFKGSDVKLTWLTSDYILSKISEYDIFKRYCTNFVEINRGFCSDLRSDRNPDVYIYNDSKGNLRYKDFAKRLNLNCFEYVMIKFGINYRQALEMIYEDLKLSAITYYVTPQKKITKLKTILNIVPRPFNIKDFEFWSKYGIDLNTLINFNVVSCKEVHYTKGDKHHIFKERWNDPIYAYKFIEVGQIYYKIYRPYSENFKFMFNGTVNYIEGYNQLPLFGDLLIITKSLKDVMVYYELGYNAISLQGEHNPLSSELFDKLQYRFKTILLNYDNDEAGKDAIEGYYKKTGEFIQGLSDQYNLPYFYIDKTKDLSDYVKMFGLKEAKILINERIKSKL